MGGQTSWQKAAQNAGQNSNWVSGQGSGKWNINEALGRLLNIASMLLSKRANGYGSSRQSTNIQDLKENNEESHGPKQDDEAQTFGQSSGQNSGKMQESNPTQNKVYRTLSNRNEESGPDATGEGIGRSDDALGSLIGIASLLLSDEANGDGSVGQSNIQDSKEGYEESPEQEDEAQTFGQSNGENSGKMQGLKPTQKKVYRTLSNQLGESGQDNGGDGVGRSDDALDSLIGVASLLLSDEAQSSK